VDYFGVLRTRWKGLMKNVLTVSSIVVLMSKHIDSLAEHAARVTRVIIN
jgi:hypothetical protein